MVKYYIQEIKNKIHKMSAVWIVLICILISALGAWNYYDDYCYWKNEGKYNWAEKELCNFGFTILFIIYMIAFLIVILCNI